MKKVLSIFAIAIFILLGACASPKNEYGPQANIFNSPVPIGHTSKTFASLSDHLNDAFAKIPGARITANAVIQVSWDLIPENDNRKARRQNCKISIKNEFDFIGTQYKCRGVERSGQDFIVAFEVKPEKGPAMVKELNLSQMSGGFIEGEMYEKPFDFIGMRWEYGSRSSKPLRIVWSTHEPIRWR